MQRYPKKLIKELKWNTKICINSNQGRRGGIKAHKTDGTTKQQITKLRLGFNYNNNYIKYKQTKPSNKGNGCQMS